MAAVGKKLAIEDIGEIIDAMETRSKNFPGEPFDMTLMLVLLNIGDRYTPVTCTEGEWVGKKEEVPHCKEGDIPKCPNGHALHQGERVTLGWMVE